MRSLIRSGSSTLAINILGTGATMATAMLLTRMLSTEDYGIYVFTMSVVAILTTACQVGGQNLAVKSVPGFVSHGQFRLLGGFLRYAFGLNIVCGMAVALLLLSLNELAPHVAGGRFVSAAAMLVPIYGVSAIISGVLRGLDKPALGILHEVVLRPVFFGIALFAAGGFFGSLVPRDSIMLNVVSAVCAVGVGLGLMYTQLRPFADRGPREYDSSRWFREAVPLLGVSLIGALIENVPAWLLISLATPTDVALFKVASQGAAFISFILLSLNSVAMPKISAAYAKNDLAEMEAISQTTVKVGLVFTLPLLILFCTVPSEIIGMLFGPRYIDAAPALVIYSVGRYFMILLGIPGAVLLMTGHAKVVMRGWILSAAVSTVLALILAPFFGYVGMAISLVIGELGLNIFLSWRVRKILGVSTQLKWAGQKIPAL